MVQEAVRHKHDPTLAHDMCQKIKNHQTYSILNEYFPFETSRLLTKLQALDHPINGNDVDVLFLILDDYCTGCRDKNILSNTDLNNINLFFDSIFNELSKLQKNITSYEVTITCALDGFTLNSTSHLAEYIENFISLHQQNFGKNAFFSFQTASAGLEPWREHELRAARQLLEFCIQLRDQIGSPETMPKGQIIDFMVHLCETVSSQTLNDGLVKMVEREVDKLRQLYPELAEAGEELQKAMASYQKP